MKNLCYFIAIVTCLFNAAFSVAADKPRNIVLFVTDDQSPDLGCYGNDVVQTPNMDRLAADGVRFTRAFCTTASCSASRSVILTGLHNHANGHYGHLHDFHKFGSYDWVQTLPVMLGRAGYRTARVGKHHNGPESVYLFETKVGGSARSPYVMADNCKSFIESSDERPFFLYFATSDPHRGGGDAKKLPHQPNRFGNKPNREAYPHIEEVIYDPKDVIVPPFLPDTPTCRAELAQYYQSISRIDQGLGRLVELLKEAGEWDNTLFVFTSDHGMAFPGAKTTVYEGGMHVPFIVRNPDLEKRGTVNNAMVSFVDITPTLLDWGGALDPSTNAVKPEIAKRTHFRQNRLREPKPYQFHGRTMLPILGDANPEGWDEVYASHTFHEIQMYYPMRVARGRRYKLIWNIAHPLPYPFASDLWAAPTWQAQYKIGMDANYGVRTVGEYIHRPEFELFDLEKDPIESINVSNVAEYADVLADMKSKLKSFQKNTDDPWILKWQYE
ncbi:sulfatase [Planctomycetota bacterium]